MLGTAVDRDELRERRATYLKAVLHSAGLKSMATLAKALGVTQSTLTNIQSIKRSASPELIRKIEQLAPRIEDGSILGAQALSAGEHVELGQSLNIEDQLKEANRERLHELLPAEERTSKNIREVARSFDSMGSDDVFIYISALRRPFEMDPNEMELKLAILNAIRRKSFFIYLRPTREHLRRLDYFVDIESEFESFKATLFSDLSKEEKATYAGHLVLVQTDHVPLFVLPDFKWHIVYSDRIDAPQNAFAGALVAAGTDLSGSGADIRIPLTVASTKRVLFEVARAIWQANSGRRGHGKVPSKVVARLVESAELATRQKIKGGS
ncbi:MAG: helix-turn-helix transcriptional regulator [Bradyrhizobium sp.]|uniref:helix-turn-helix domain-containing protein n=1 Tax=Bradyrhizobium sp. TaxID=376 RepID=UPI001DB2AF42|nr:helix-turn-helix transcriptional regulator [Bradyrhizobium sp.]MBV9562335.1 helix-turn-helix transcriptional regulator [Bradyrhizobium sp.]